jgi:iron complex outermembrane receptor protein
MSIECDPGTHRTLEKGRIEMRHPTATYLSGCAIAAMLLPLAGTAFAQDEPAIERPAGDDIIVTARKVAENVQDVPISMTAIGGAALERQSVQSIADVQQQVPNLFLQESASEPQALNLSLRGQRQNDILLTVDPSVGIYVDNLYYPRTMGLRNALVDVARVEVLRGPQGTLYGRNTTGGAMSIYSNDPTDQMGASVEASYGNYNAWELIGIANVPLTQDVALRVVAQHREHDGYGENAAGQDLANENSTYLRAKLKAQLGDRITATVSGSYQRGSNNGPIVKLAGLAPTAIPGGNAVAEIALELGLPLTAEGLTEASGILASYVGGDPYKSGVLGNTSSFFESWSVGLDLNFEITDDISFRSITGYQHLKRANYSDADGTPFDIISAERLTPQDGYFSQEWQVLGKTGILQWVAGVYMGLESGREYSPSVALPMLSAANPSVTDGRVRNNTYAGFGQVTAELATGLRLTAGARYSVDDRQLIVANTTAGLCAVPKGGYASTIAGGPNSQCPRKFSTTFSDPSWLVSLDYKAAPGILTYAKIARGYRTGGWNLRGRNTIEGFSSFDPETVTEYEVGFKSDLFDRMLRLNFAAFYDDYKGIQRSASVATAGGPQTFVNNAASGRIQGFELESTLHLGDFTLSGSTGLTDAKYKRFLTATGDRSHESFGIPKWTAGLSGRYVVPLESGDLAFQLDGSYRSKIELVPETPTVSQVTQKAYALVNGRISYEIKAWDAEVAIFGRNLTDKVYYEIASNLESSIGYNYLITGDPRTFGISFKKKFGGI